MKLFFCCQTPAANGGTTPFSAATGSAGVTVAMTFTAVKEDTRAPAGNAVRQVLAPSFVAENPGARNGIAVVELTGTTQGTWEYSTGGGPWKAIGRVSGAHARLLALTDKVRFVPNANFVGRP